MIFKLENNKFLRNK